MSDWFVVRTKARQEGRAISHLQEQGFKVYCPLIPKYDALKEEAGRQVLSRVIVLLKAASNRFRAFVQRQGSLL